MREPPPRISPRGLAACCLVAVCLVLSCSGADRTEEAGAAVARARELFEQRGPRAAIPEWERALGLYRQAGDRAGEALVLCHLGHAWHRFGDHVRALKLLDEALAIKRELKDRVEEAKTLNSLGLVYWSRADHDRAVGHFETSLALARQAGERRLEGAALNNLGLVADERGDHAGSFALYEEALALFRAIGDVDGENNALGNIGGVHLLLGRYKEALDFHLRALKLAEDHGLRYETAVDLGNAGLAYLGLGEIDPARDVLERAVSLAREIGARQEEADALRGLGTLARRRGRYELALAHYREALHGTSRQRAATLREMGHVHLLTGDLGEAESSFRAALELASTAAPRRGVVVSLLSLGGLEWRRQRFSAAGSLYREAMAQAEASDDRLHLALGAVRLAVFHFAASRLEDAHHEAQRGRRLARVVGAPIVEAQALLALGEIERVRGYPESSLGFFQQAGTLLRDSGIPEVLWRSAHGEGKALTALGRTRAAIAAHARAVDVIEGVRYQLVPPRLGRGL